MNEQSPNKKPTRTLYVMLFLFLLVTLIVGVAFTWLFNKGLLPGFFDSLRAADPAEKQRILSEKKAQETLILLEKHIQLPDEDPTVATVNDISKLGELPFYDLAQEGDRVILFPQAKKIILYRPTLDKIIDVATLTITEEKTDTLKTTPKQ